MEMKKSNKRWLKVVNGLGYAFVDAVAFAFFLCCVVFVLFVSGLIFTSSPSISLQLLTVGMMSVVSFGWFYYRIVGSYKK